MLRNSCKFIGRLGSDLEVRYTTSGVACGNASLAVSERFKKKSGEIEEKTTWIKLIFWNKSADYAKESLVKGDLVAVEAKYSTRAWEDKEGKKQYAHEFIVDEFQKLNYKPKEDKVDDGNQYYR
jgi:single-strand DNA-binding protein